MFSMRQLLTCALLSAAVLSTAMVAPAQAAFNGTWRADLSKAKFSEKPFTFDIRQGWFHCVTCIPAMTIRADGKDHAVTGQAVDTIRITPVDERSLRMMGKKGGRVVFNQISTLSEDGNNLTVQSTTYPGNGKKPVTVKNTLRREGALQAGTYPASGSWIAEKASGSENGLLATFKTNNGEITMTDPAGESYTARFDGRDASVKGANGWDTVSLKLVNDRTIEETDKFHGNVTSVSTMTVSADGRTMTVVATEKPDERTSTYTWTKQ